MDTAQTQPPSPSPNIVYNSNQSFLDRFKKPFIFFSSLLIILVVTLALIYYLPKLIQQNKTISPDILSSNQPVLTINGTIEKIDNQIITLSYTHILTPFSSTGEEPPSNTLAKFDYKITISPKTNITYFGTISNKSSPLTIKNLQVGQVISVTSKTDIRQLSKRQFEAVSITLPPRKDNVQGKILDIKTNTLTIQTIPTASDRNSKDQPKTYLVTIDGKTQFFHPDNDPNPKIPPRPKQIAPTDLKKGMDILVYFDPDLSTKESLKAIKIEPTVATVPPVFP